MSRISKVKHQMLLSEWSVRIHDCQTSGLKVQEWCNQNGLNIKTYYYWLRKVREQSLACIPNKIPVASEMNAATIVAEEKITFKQLEVQVPVPRVQAAVIVHLPSATLEVTDGASKETVEAVLLALRSVC